MCLIEPYTRRIIPQQPTKNGEDNTSTVVPFGSYDTEGREFTRIFEE